jgi:hypothetical protein
LQLLVTGRINEFESKPVPRTLCPSGGPAR